MKKNIFLCIFLCLSLFACNISVYAADALPAVVEQNTSKMEHINDHGAEFVVDYISESWDYNTVESILNQVKTLSDEICSGCKDDYEKICAMADYVSSTLSYDLDAKHNAVTFDVISLENVLEKKRTTCAGFSNLFSSMCNAQGLYCVNIRGSAISPSDGIYSSNLDDENTVMNHEWTAVYYDAEQRWVYVDCTWDCTNYYENGEFRYGGSVRTIYRDISLENISKDHKAIIVDHREFFDALTVLEKPYSETESPQTQAETAAETQPSANNDNSSENIPQTEAFAETTTAVQSETSVVSTALSETSVSESEKQSVYVSDSEKSEVTGAVSVSESEISSESTEKITDTEEKAVQTVRQSEKNNNNIILPVILISASVIIIIAVIVFVIKKKVK